MKKFTFLLYIATIFIIPLNSNGQLEAKKPVAPIRCGTMEAIQQQIDNDPIFRAQYEKGLREYEASKIENGGTNPLHRTTTLNGPVIIPVVVHIVLPNPYIVTDADVDYFINRLNQDYSGLNSDSTNATAFYPIRGHSLIRFTRAKRDPNGNFTTGIERKVGSGTINGSEPQPVKNVATGGLNPWDHTRYYNLWVGIGAGGLLGIAPQIGVGTAATDGVCIDYKAFANNSCYSIPQFNLARTAVHEIGHNFGLYHTFQNGCASPNDFGQLTSGCSLPASLLATADDTPAQSNETSGCPSGTLNAGCPNTPNPPGKNYQNYMDYTDDACYSMFTKGQVERMHYVLEVCRPGYLTTDGHLPPANMPTLDVAPIDVVNPGGVEVTGCNSTNYSNLTCPGTISPKMRFVNRGTSTITSVVAGFQLNNNTPIETTISVNIPTGNSAVATYPSVNIPSGNHTLKFWTKSPNSTTDQITSNDTITINISVGVGATLPLSEDFSNAAFPPAGWTRVRVEGNTPTAPWDRSTATASGTPGSARAFLWDIEAGNKLDLRTPLIATTATDSMFVSFDVAHTQYNNVQDTLQLLASADCGNTFVKVWEQWSSILSTTSPSSSSAQLINPTGNEWKNIRVALPIASAPNILNGTNVIFAWRAISNFGNNIFIDNINIAGRNNLSLDIQPVTFTAPAFRICSGSNVKPIINIKNNGNTTVTSFNLNYTVNGSTATVIPWTGTLPKDAIATIDLNTSNYNEGTYTIKAWTSSPNGQNDQLSSNDTLYYTFTVETIITTPLVESFETAIFPPPGWAISQQPADDTTWTRTAMAGNNSYASAYMPNFRYSVKGAVDNLLTPVIRYSGADSVFIKFDVAASTKSYPGSTAVPLDTLEVLMSTDCGVTFTSVYKKWGHELQTIGDPNYPNTTEFQPKHNGHWRRDSVNLTGLLGSANTVRFAFRNKNNFENNIYIDNVDFTPKVLSEKIKRNGYMITPNPFTSNFTIQHYLAPTTLTGFGIYNSVGQQIITRTFKGGNADSFINVNMARFPAGIYTVQLIYTDHTVSQKIIKVN